MRIASSGRNPSDKENSDHNEMASVDNRSFDPDHEPRKEGTMKLKHSPSIAEIHNDGGLSDGASIGGKRRDGQSRSLGRVIENEEDTNNNYRSMNSNDKNSRSQRKIKPI